MNINFPIAAGLTLAMAAMTGCSTVPSSRYSQLPSASFLQDNKLTRSDRRPAVYRTPVDWNQYQRAVLDPIAIYSGPEAQFVNVTHEDQRVLTEEMYQAFAGALAHRFEPVSRLSKGTLRVRVTLTGASESRHFVATAMKFDLAGSQYNLIQAARGKKGAFTGSVSYAVEIYDGPSDRLLMAYTETQYPNAMNPKATASHLGASKAGILKGAQTLQAAFHQE